MSDVSKGETNALLERYRVALERIARQQVSHGEIAPVAREALGWPIDGSAVTSPPTEPNKPCRASDGRGGQCEREVGHKGRHANNFATGGEYRWSSAPATLPPMDKAAEWARMSRK